MTNDLVMLSRIVPFSNLSSLFHLSKQFLLKLCRIVLCNNHLVRGFKNTFKKPP